MNITEKLHELADRAENVLSDVEPLAFEDLDQKEFDQITYIVAMLNNAVSAMTAFTPTTEEDDDE